MGRRICISKTEEGIYWIIYCIPTPIFSHRRVVSNDEIKYIDYLCFTVFVRKNNLSPRQDNYSEEQEELHSQIKKLHDKGYSYKRITKYLNAKGIKILRGKTFWCVWKYCSLNPQKIQTTTRTIKESKS